MIINGKSLQDKRPDLWPPADLASAYLEKELGLSSAFVRVEWDFEEGSRDPVRQAFDLPGAEGLVLVRISDGGGAVEYRFEPDELSDAAHMKVKMHRLWSDLLMVQSHVQLDRMSWQLNHAGNP